MTVNAFILLAIVLPCISGVAVKVVYKDNSIKLGFLSSLVSLAVLVSAIFLYPEVYSGHAEVTVRNFLPVGMVFRVAPAGYVFVLLTSLVWFASSLFSIAYMEKNHYQGRFYMFFLITLGSTLGVFLAGDMVTLFIFFEVMSLASFALVIHEQDAGAAEAGNLYIFMSMFGSLLALMGLFMLYHRTGTLDMLKLGQVPLEMSPERYVIYFSIVLGFGVKAGMVPFHIWLPKAHPAAPSPASAILSGILLKTGIYGILTVSLSFMGQSTVAGNTLLVMGAVTMVEGAYCALRSANFKRLLAYSSMSQMGYVIMSIGAALVLGKDGWLGFAGGIYQAVNHGIYEAMLFLIAGYLLMSAGSIELVNLRGFAARDRLAGFFLIIGLAAISGFPGLNGFVGKTLIHDALLVAMEEAPGIFYSLAEKAFMLGSVFTAAYSIKLVALLFDGGVAGALPADKRPGKRNLVVSAASFAVLSLMVPVTGIMPGLLLGLINPALSQLHYHPVHIYSMETLLGSAKVYLLGFGAFLLYKRFGKKAPKCRPDDRSDKLGLFSSLHRSISQKCGLERMIVPRQGRMSEALSKFFDLIGRIIGFGAKGLGFITGIMVRACEILAQLFNLIDKSLGFGAKGPGILNRAIRRTFETFSRLFNFIDRSFSFEGSIYRPLIQKAYDLSNKVFGIIDRGTDLFYTLFTSFLTGIYHMEDNRSEETVVMEIRERGVLYKKYSRIAREIMHGHFREAGALVCSFFREREYSSFNLNVGVILFAAIVVIFMLIFVMCVPLLTSGI